MLVFEGEGDGVQLVLVHEGIFVLFIQVGEDAGQLWHKGRGGGLQHVDEGEGGLHVDEGEGGFHMDEGVVQQIRKDGGRGLARKR